MSMMAFGDFVFALVTVPYQEMRHAMGWRHPSNSRVGARPASQFTGPDDETITLSGAIPPEITGGLYSLTELRAFADAGDPQPLIDGGGTVLGWFVITQLENTRRTFMQDGAALQIDFTMTLKRVDDDDVTLLGSEAR